MMRRPTGEAGFTMIELLIALSIFGAISIGLYSVLFAGTRASDTAQGVAHVSEEARLGLNRMVRDTREGQLFSSLQDDRFNVRIDFDSDGIYENPNENGDYEDLTYTYAGNQVRLNGEILIDDVYQFPQGCTPGSTCEPVFTYTSNDLHYDWNGDGVTTKDELNRAPSKGFPGVTGTDSSLYNNVEFHFLVGKDRDSTEFSAQAQLRNRR